MPVDAQTQQTVQHFQDLAARMLIAELAGLVIGTILFFWLLYLTLRYAIRDGMRDAQRLDRRIAPVHVSREHLPDMRAD